MSLWNMLPLLLMLLAVPVAVIVARSLHRRRAAWSWPVGIITRESMFQPLLEADPSLTPVWTDFLAEWEGERDQPLYLALASVARHLIGQLKSGETDHFPAVFEVVERWHLQGDAYVREAASVGLLEDLQHTNLHDGTEPAAFEPWLRPESKRWWKKVERFWLHREPLVDN